MPFVYYNEIDPYCCAWLKNLMAARLIPYGDIDSRSIKDVSPDDLAPYDQCHFFAGIAGWSLALRLAGWPDSRPVWTGSCPCQPFSVAGKRQGFADERHLWPEFYRLIAQRLPPIVFGEQVAAATAWLSGVRSDLEKVDYAVGAIPIQAACAGATQYRDRIWFVANRDRQLSRDEGLQRGRELGGSGGTEKDPVSVLASDASERRKTRISGQNEGEKRDAGLSINYRDRSRQLVLLTLDGWGKGWSESDFLRRGFTSPVASISNGEYAGIQFIGCPDGKFRRLPPPRVRWLGNGIPSRTSKLRAYGNAIYPPVATEFIASYLDLAPS